MNIGIMQPYFLPYIGYFQLISTVDLFVIHDDVQWIKNGWINRNRIYSNNGDKFISLPILKDSSYLNINQRYFSNDIDAAKEKMARLVKETYRKAPHFAEAFELFQRCLACDDKNVSSFVVNSLQACCDFIDINTPIRLSSELVKNNELKAQDRVIDICKVVGGDTYTNPSGGIDLYDSPSFQQHGIKLQFLIPQSVPYQQFHADYIPFLSFLDVAMFNSKADIKAMLSRFTLQ